MAAAAVALPTMNDSFNNFAMLPSRPQVGIGRLPVRRPSNESKQSMNCKSCRKRKIKCNRLKPSCEACQVFNCACVYDAVPKKRGPKTDVLEALVKRVNGLERRLKDETKSEADDHGESSDQTPTSREDEPTPIAEHPHIEHRLQPESSRNENRQSRSSLERIGSNVTSYQTRESIAFTDALLDTYFAQIHSKPYYILDEANTRQRLREGQLPQFMVNAIHAVSIRYVPHLCGGYDGAIRTSQECGSQSRAAIDVDEPSIDHLQGLLLLAMANFQVGKGKKSYMLLSHAISMAFALDLHREVPSQVRVASVEREGRRKLFWTCFLMDRFTTSGSKRPPLISDDSISLRYPAWTQVGPHRNVEGTFFPIGCSLPHASDHSGALRGGGAMLVDIVRILGVTNRYLASGGVKGDSHFPWHTQSVLSRIRADLDKWAANAQDVFSSLNGLFGQPDSVTLVLSKLIYHLIHCLLYRPFLPVDLAELSGNGQNQSWQIEAMNLCFRHANAIVELVDIGKSTGINYWPSFVGYCVCTAGTIHVHGAHYVSLREGDAFAGSAEFISREMSQLADLTCIWAGVHHQRETMQLVYANHARLVQSLDSSPIRFSPVFQMEDFFDRYPGSNIDGAHMTFLDISNKVPQDPRQESLRRMSTHQMWSNISSYSHRSPSQPTLDTQNIPSNSMPALQRPQKRRRLTEDSAYPTPTLESQSNPFDQDMEMLQPNMPPILQHPQPDHEPNNQPHHFHTNDQHLNPTLSESVFSPSFAFSPSAYNIDIPSIDAHPLNLTQPVTTAAEMQTPDALSTSAQSSNAVEAENDPFLSFLEQLAENDGSGGGRTDLDVFMGGGNDSGVSVGDGHDD